MRTDPRLIVVAAGVFALASTPERAEASCIPGFDYAAFADDKVEFQGNADTDSYDSSLGTFAATVACTGGDLGTNNTAGSSVHVQGVSSTICGNASIGFGGNPVTAITGNGTITGTKAALAANLALPIAAFPALPLAGSPNPSFFNVAASLAPGFDYQDVSCHNGSLSLDAGQYIVKTMSLTAGCQLVLNTGPVEIYFTDNLQLQAGVIANAGLVASKLVFFGGPTAANVQVQGGATAAFAVYAPATLCQVQGNSDVYGSLVCEEVQVQGNGAVHYDRALANFGAGGFVCPSIEVSRASPIIAALGGQQTVVQGTFERPTTTKKTIASIADIAGFEFPFLRGHLRARTAASITTTASAFSSGTILFDAGAAGSIPAVNTAGCGTFNGACRQVFTNTTTPPASGTIAFPPRVQLNDTNASAIGSLIAPAATVPGIGAAHWQTIVRRVLAGHTNGTVSRFGGVDRSTVAVIPPSPLAGTGTRPTIAYVGAADGMLHAVCASTGGTTPSQVNICPSLGTELWAFLPRVQLPLIRTNTARIDGSVHVADVFGDFNNPPTGKKSFRTILVFQTGTTDAATTPAAYALDVTDPAKPIIVWERVAASPAGGFELGVGLVSTIASVQLGPQTKNLAVLQTNNGGTGGAGTVVGALELETGLPVWQFGFAYPTPPRGLAADLPLPVAGVPGGVVAVDLVGQGLVTDLVFGDLYGQLWKIAADTGISRTGPATPLFRFSANKRPVGAVPAIYSNGTTQIAAFASGGYVDPAAATWTTSAGQRLVAVKLNDPGPYPLDETSPTLAINEVLAAGERTLAQALVVGNQLFVTTDVTDVNTSAYGTGGATGHVLAYDLITTTSTSTVVQGGASTLAATTAGTLYNASSDQQQQLAAAATPGGPSVDGFVLPKLTRRLWLSSL